MMCDVLLRRVATVCVACVVFATTLQGRPQRMESFCRQDEVDQDPSVCCRAIHQQLIETTDEALLENLCSALKPNAYSEQRTPISLSVMVPYWDRTTWPVGPSLETSILLALWHINYCSDLPAMKNFYLKAKFFDSGCDANRGSKALVDILDGGDAVGIIGPDCSSVALPTAMFSSFLNLTMVAYGCEALQLSDRTKYKTFYRLTASSNLFQITWRAFFDHFNWTRVATLLELGREFDGSLTKFQNEFEASGNQLVFSRSFFPSNFNASSIMDDIDRRDVVVILAMVYPTIARQLLCLALHEGRSLSCCPKMAKPGLVWIFPSWFSPNWFNETVSVATSNNKTLFCSKAQMTHAAAGSFVVNSEFLAAQESRVTIARNFSMDADEWLQVYQAVFNKCWNYIRDNSTWSNDLSTDYSSYAYDATWTWAHASDRVLELHPSFGFNTDSKSRGLLNATIQSLPEFNGVSGRVSFQGADRPRLRSNLRNIDAQGTYKVVGYMDNFNSSRLHLTGEKIYWGNCCGSEFVPKDRSKPAWTWKKDDCSEALIDAFGTCQAAVAILITVPMVVIVTIIILVVVKGLKKRYKKKYVRHFENRLFELGLTKSKIEKIIDIDEEWEIDRKQIMINRKLGEGEFGEVFGAEATDLVEGHAWIPVAVKSLREGSTIEEKVQFLTEAQIMKRFTHPHIVQLLGLCTLEEPILVVMEMMLHGDLKSYLLAHRHLCNTGMPEELTSSRLTLMMAGVAKGLAYLAQEHYVHRDIAARNCMVTANYTVKIGDFGMTRDMYQSDYYRIMRAAPLPVRWMSPESLLDGIFTNASDMWSFGIVVWEAATFGAMPFGAYSSQEVVEFIREGLHPNLPKGCTVGLKALLQWCWTIKPERRATAAEVVDFLAKNTSIVQPCTEPSTQREEPTPDRNHHRPHYENQPIFTPDSPSAVSMGTSSTFSGGSVFLRRTNSFMTAV